MGYCSKQEKINGKAFMVIVLLVFLLVSGVWGACTVSSASNVFLNCRQGNRDGSCKSGTSYSFQTGCPNDCSSVSVWCAGGSNAPTVVPISASARNCDWFGDGGGQGQFNYTYYQCTNQCEADSIKCINDGGTWANTGASTCSGFSCTHCDAQCQCEESGGVWHPDGYCVPACETRKCCDSLNVVLPVTYDTSWNGCVNGPNGGCETRHSYTLDGQVARTWYDCTGLSSYTICQNQYIMDGEGTCSPAPDNNACVDVTAVEDRCSNTQCQEVWDKDFKDFNLNKQTMCWEGQYRLVIHMECDNGVRTMPSYGEWHDWTVCDSWLDSSGITISEYVESNSAGGQSVDAQGNLVDNSPGGGQGGSYTEVTKPVTQYDSTTGTTTIVKNSQGNDSMQTVTVFETARCIGVTNGIATMSNGSYTWTCAAMSCAQANLKYRMGTGCSVGDNSGLQNDDVSTNQPQVAWSDSVTHQDGGADFTDAMNNMSRTATWFYNFFAFPSTYKSFADAVNAIVSSVNSGAERSLAKSDSIYERSKEELWKRVFGNDLSGVTDLASSVTSASSVNSQVISSATSTLSTNISAASQRIVSATSDVTLAVGDASVNISNKIMSASSANSQAIGNAASAVTDKITSASSRHLDTLHGIHQTLDVMGGAIAGALDTGGVFKQTRDTLHAFHSSFSDYVNLVTEHHILMDSITQAARDTSHNTNVILSEISDKLDNISPASSSSEQYVEVDTSYLDTGDYELDADLVHQDSVLSEEIQVMSDSIKGMAGALKRGMDSVFAHVDSVRADTNNNFLAMDSIYKWHKDTTKIKQKFSQFFLPSQMSNNCFVCTYNEKWWKFDVDLSFNLGNVYGLNLCELLRNIVKVIVTICIIFSTIGAFIRAFGGGGGGSP